MTGAIGTGVLMTTTLPAVQAPLPESDVEVSVGTWDFVGSLGRILGVAIPAAVFNSTVDELVSRLEDQDMRQTLSRGGAYSLASGDFITSLDHDSRLKAAVKGIYVDSIARSWQVRIAVALIGFLTALAVEAIPLRTELETNFGLGEGERQDTEGDVGTWKEYASEPNAH
jgi:hypothetical protein